MLHSLDSMKLALSLCSFFSKDTERKTPLSILIQIKLDHHSQNKTGTDFHEASQIIKVLNESPKLKFCGFMAIGPKSEKETLDFLYKDFVKEASSIIKRENIDRPIISLGMSRDFLSAIEAGSTCVRIGSRIFNSEAV